MRLFALWVQMLNQLSERFTILTLKKRRYNKSESLCQRFLYNMARAMVGTVIYASIGKLEPEDISKILESGDRCLAGPTVPPHGLYLTKIWYDGAVGNMFK